MLRNEIGGETAEHFSGRADKLHELLPSALMTSTVNLTETYKHYLHSYDLLCD